MNNMRSKTLQPCYEKSKEIISQELSTFLQSQFSPWSSVQTEEKNANIPEYRCLFRNISIFQYNVFFQRFQNKHRYSGIFWLFPIKIHFCHDILIRKSLNIPEFLKENVVLKKIDIFRNKHRYSGIFSFFFGFVRNFMLIIRTEGR